MSVSGVASDARANVAGSILKSAIKQPELALDLIEKTVASLPAGTAVSIPAERVPGPADTGVIIDITA